MAQSSVQETPTGAVSVSRRSLARPAQSAHSRIACHETRRLAHSPLRTLPSSPVFCPSSSVCAERIAVCSLRVYTVPFHSYLHPVHSDSLAPVKTARCKWLDT